MGNTIYGDDDVLKQAMKIGGLSTLPRCIVTFNSQLLTFN